MHSFDDFRAIVRPAEPLAPHVWFRLGGPAAFLARPRTLDEVLGLLRRCREIGLPFKVLGGGSNVLVRDEGVDALVIHLESPAFSDVHREQPHRDLRRGRAAHCLDFPIRRGRASPAWRVFTGIPGTVGGALTRQRGRTARSHRTIRPTCDRH